MSHSNPIVRANDVLIQKIARLSPCIVSGYQPAIGHHMMPRSNMFFRHDLRNILPLIEPHHVGTVLSPHGTPKNFELWMGAWHLERLLWVHDNKNVYHKNPTDDDLRATRKFLRAFLKAGRPYVWSPNEQVS